MNDTEKTAIILRVIAYLLCAILIMQVILFAGITAFADSVNLFIPEQSVLNHRINSSGNFVSAPNEGYFITNYIQYNSEPDVYIYSPYVLSDVKCKIAFLDSTDNTVDAQAVFTSAFVTRTSQDDGYIYKVNISNSGFLTNNYFIFQLCNIAFLNPTYQDIADFKINFTGDFTDTNDDISIISYLDGWFDFLPSVATNLSAMIYNNGSFTIIGYGLFFIVGLGVVFGIISLIFKALRGGK